MASIDSGQGLVTTATIRKSLPPRVAEAMTVPGIRYFLSKKLMMIFSKAKTVEPYVNTLQALE